MSGISGVAFSNMQFAMERFGTGAKVGSVKLPNFKNNVMYTRTEPSMSDEELKETIARIAREDAEKGQLQSQTKEFLDLKIEYVSSVSPDRESIITNSTKQIFADADSIKSKNKGHALTLLELLIDKDKDNKIIIANMSGDRYGKACLEGDKLTYAGFYDGNGELIADYDSKTGWSGLLTKEETEREREFYSTYNEAWQGAKAEISLQNSASVPKYVDGGAAIDAYA